VCSTGRVAGRVSPITAVYILDERGGRTNGNQKMRERKREREFAPDAIDTTTTKQRNTQHTTQKGASQLQKPKVAVGGRLCPYVCPVYFSSAPCLTVPSCRQAGRRSVVCWSPFLFPKRQNSLYSLETQTSPGQRSIPQWMTFGLNPLDTLICQMNESIHHVLVSAPADSGFCSLI